MKKSLNEAAALKRDLTEEKRISHALIDSSVRLNSMFNLPELLQTIMPTSVIPAAAKASSP